MEVKFGLPFGARFSRTNFTACLSSSSFCHKTPWWLFYPCRVSGNTSSLVLNCAHHSLMVQPLLPSILPIISAVSFLPNFSLVLRRLLRRRDIDMSSSLLIVPSHSWTKSSNRASSSFCGRSYDSSLPSKSSSSPNSADVSIFAGDCRDGKWILEPEDGSACCGLELNEVWVALSSVHIGSNSDSTAVGELMLVWDSSVHNEGIADNTSTSGRELTLVWDVPSTVRIGGIDALTAEGDLMVAETVPCRIASLLLSL